MSQIGHLRKRKDKNGRIRYQMIIEVWKDGRKIFKSKTFSTEKEAKSWGSKIRYEIEKGFVTKESLKNRKLSDAIDRFIIDVLPQKPKNARNVQQHLKWWRNELGNRQLTELTSKEIAECRDKLLKEPTHKSKSRAPATVVRYLSSLSSVFEVAIKEWHWIEKNPVKLIRKPKVSNARTRFLNEEECKKLLACCKESRNPYLYSIVILALCTGMRRGEILSMCWGDIDFEKKLIVLSKTKNGSVRYVPIVGIAYQILKNLFDVETFIEPTFQVFPSLNLERYLDIRTAWFFALKRAEITQFTFHDLRHSCASFLAMSGATQRDIAEILGHRDMRMTHRYSHLTQKHLAGTLERAAEKFIGHEV
jgi:integrase